MLLLYLGHHFYNKIFKIKYELFIFSLSPPLRTNKKILGARLATQHCRGCASSGVHP
jgi:hypothetical protein